MSDIFNHAFDAFQEELDESDFIELLDHENMLTESDLWDISDAEVVNDDEEDVKR